MQSEVKDSAWSAASFNGINGATGNYLMPALSPREVAKVAAGERFTPEELAELKRKLARVRGIHLGFAGGIDDQDLAKVGWGVIFAPDITEEVKSALSPLLKLRHDQAGDLYTDFPDQRAYRDRDDKNEFLKHSGMGPGTPIPKKVPYYLLIVGSPESIPYRFQYQLDVQYAVGRIHFDTPEEYRQYAHSAVKAEKGDIRRPRQGAFFGVRNRADRATQLSADHLIRPLHAAMAAAEDTWEWPSFCADEATKENLSELLGGNRTPALLVTASHGMAFPNGDEKQSGDQGALLCQDWPGPLKHRGAIPEDFYMAGRHVTKDASVEGLITFCFACYGAGTPKLDDFAHLVDGPQATIAPQAFVGCLPKRLLSHPQGSALAVIGHVERAWTYSFMWEGAGEQLGVFENALTALIDGKRVGSAMDEFNRRYAELSSDLTSEIENRKYYLPDRPEPETQAEDEKLAGLWTANNDARSFVVLGDPAVRLAVGD